MRSAAWATTAIVMFGCAQGAPAGDPAEDVSAAAAPDAGPADADGGVLVRACDPSIAAGEGVAITDTGACPGVIPPTASCAAELTVCAGLGSGANGVYGNIVSRATSDGRGSAVLSCQRSDVGPADLNFLFVPTRSGFVSKAALGADVRPLRDGFITSEGSYVLPPPTYLFLAHDGGFRASQKGGTLHAGPDGAVIVRAVNGQLLAESFAADGTAKTTAVIGAFTGSGADVMPGGATSSTGATLVIWQIYGEGAANARWLGADGSVSGAAFSIAGWTSSVPQAAALAGGVIAVAAEPQSGVTARTWRGIVAAGEMAERPAPAWLASRGDFLLLPEGRAMAFGSEIVAADGTRCGTVNLGAPLVGIGVDGTTFTARSQRTFRIYPQLFR